MKDPSFLDKVPPRASECDALDVTVQPLVPFACARCRDVMIRSSANGPEALKAAAAAAKIPRPLSPGA